MGDGLGIQSDTVSFGTLDFDLGKDVVQGLKVLVPGVNPQTNGLLSEVWIVHHLERLRRCGYCLHSITW